MLVFDGGDTDIEEGLKRQMIKLRAKLRSWSFHKTWIKRQLPSRPTQGFHLKKLDVLPSLSI